MATAVDTENSLLSAVEAVEWLGSTGSTDLWYRIYGLVNNAAARMNHETGRLLKNRAVTEYYDGDGSTMLMLNQFPLSSTTITITKDGDGTRGFTTTYQMTTTDIRCDTEMAVVQVVGDVFTEGYRNIKVVYSAGYSSSESNSAALVSAQKDYVQLLWNRNVTNRGSIGVRSESAEGGSRTYETDMPWSVVKVLQGYKDRRYA